MCHRSVGLVQNHIEAAGLPTISMTSHPHITGCIGVPRAVYIRFPVGNQIGEAGKPQQQRAILTAALEAAWQIQKPDTVLELPFRWRRFQGEEVARINGVSQGARHPEFEAIGEALDETVRRAKVYRAYLTERLEKEKANPNPIPRMAMTLERQIDRVDKLIELLDTAVLDQMREAYNPIASLELTAAGKFV